MTNRQDKPNLGHRLAAMLAAALFLATTLTIAPKEADASICYCNPCDVTVVECANLWIDLVWNLACNPVNPTAPPSEPSGPAPGGPSSPDGPTAIRECQNLNDLVAYAVQEAGWAIGYANGRVAWVEDLATHPCGSQSCLQSCGSGTGYVVDGVRVCLDRTGLCGSGSYGVWVDGIPVCVTVGVCLGPGYGVTVNGTNHCITPGYTGLCQGSTEEGVVVDGIKACATVTGCGPPRKGVIVDGVSVCLDVTLGRTGPCSDGKTGAWADGTEICYPPCSDGQTGAGPACEDLGGIGSGGVGGGTGPGGLVPGVDCPTVAGVACAALVPLDRAAIVAYDAWGLAVASPAVGGAAFRVIVLGLPSNARHVEIYGDGSLLDTQNVALLSAPSTYNSAVIFEGVPLLASNNYRVSVVDGSNSDIATDSLNLWDDLRQYITTPGANGPDSPSNPDNSTTPGPEGPSSPTPNCSGPGQTYATEGAFEGTDDKDGDGYNVNYGPIYQRGIARTWSWGVANSCGSTAFPDCSWGFANNYYGRSWMVGTGPQEFGFTNDYAGCGNDLARQCFGCQQVGHAVTVSHATSFMVDPPSNLQASYNRLDQVSIPASSTTDPPPEAAFLVDTLGELASMLHFDPSTVGQVLDFAAPGLVETWNNDWSRNWVPISQGPFDRSVGGGIDVKVGTPDQKVVSGIHHWDFNGYGKFQWELQSSAYMDGMFRACNDCGAQGNAYYLMVKNYRNAQLSLTPPQ